MTGNQGYRLCGGTFFTLLSDARKPPLSKAQCYSGKKSGITEPEMLLALAKAVVPDLPTPMVTERSTIRDNTRDFKACINWGGRFLRFNDAGVKKSFDNRVKTDYIVPLAEMARFVDTFLDAQTSTKKDEYLIKALVEVIVHDEGIDRDQQFYVCEDGSALKKDEIDHAAEICVQPFLLGVWHYVLTKVPDNKIGADTYAVWCPPQNGAERVYTAAIGEQSTRSIRLTYCNAAPTEEQAPPTVDAEIVDDDAEIPGGKQAPFEGDKKLIGLHQTIMNNYGKGVQIEKVEGTLTININ